MISKDFVLNRLLEKEEFVFSQGPYYLPTRLMSRRTGKEYSIRKTIKDHIENEDRTGAVKDFLKLFDPWRDEQVGRKFDYIREMIFLIRESDYQDWIKLYDGDREERLCRNLFITDLFFPYLNLVLELDGLAYHEYLDPDKPKYDQARDQFLFMKYGIKTVRLVEKTTELRLGTTKRILRKQTEHEIPAFIDYSNEILDMYFNHSYTPECFEIIEKYFLDLPGFYNIKNEKVGFPNSIPDSDRKFIDENKEYIKEILHDLYGKILIYS
jgi:hypothetical protein